MFKKEETKKEEQNSKECSCGPDCNCKKELIEKLQKEKEEYLNGWKRERADFLNYKKEEMERIVELIKYANEELVIKILPILDNFLAAEKNIPEELKKDKHMSGLLQINQQIKSFLKGQDIEEIKAVGEQFNPNFHESVGEISNIQHPTPNTIVEEVQKGYTLHGKVIRPAKVKITK
jgi:molecular chaperone GrpE